MDKFFQTNQLFTYLNKGFSDSDLSIFIFGSRMYGSFETDSDVDLFVIGTLQNDALYQLSDINFLKICGFEGDMTVPKSDIESLYKKEIDITQITQKILGLKTDIYIASVESLIEGMCDSPARILRNRFNSSLIHDLPVYTFSCTNGQKIKYTQILFGRNDYYYDKSSPGLIDLKDGSLMIGTTADKILQMTPIIDNLDVKKVLIYPAWIKFVSSIINTDTQKHIKRVGTLFARANRFPNEYFSALERKYDHYTNILSNKKGEFYEET